MRTVATAIVSDLHLGTVSGADLARGGPALDRLLDVLAGAERIVLLGDLLELREQPATAVLEDVAPTLRLIGEAAAGKRVVVVPGNHDHQLVAPALERARLAGGTLAIAAEHPPEPGELAARLAEAMPAAEVAISYPGVWLRDDVYAFHGHYLDAHLTVPRVECLIAAAVERFATGVGADGPQAAVDYEAILAPIYALSHAVAQNARPHPPARRNNLSRDVWQLATTDGAGTLPDRLRRRLVGQVAIPAAVATVNWLGLGPFSAELSPTELREAGLRAIGAVTDRLAISDAHVIFGHTHRAGPLPADDPAGWRLPGGGTLTNAGSWIDEAHFTANDGPTNPYWPGRVVWVDAGGGPPRLETVLEPAERTAARRG